jgi:hypothetical protein
MKTFFAFICVICAALGIWSCSEIKSYSDIPEIHFKQLSLEDRIDPLDQILKKAVLCFSFIDGDGDLGVTRSQDVENASRIYYEWFFKNSDDNYEPYIFGDPDMSLASDIPYSQVMDKSEAQNKTLKGTIEIELSTPERPADSIMYVKFYITDRKGHVSNNDSTPPFNIYSEAGTIIKSQK